MSVTREYESSEFAEDYEEIERAVMESARGRWFLAEYSKRQRAEDTALILGAIRRLEASLKPAANAAFALAKPLVSETFDPPELTAEALRYYRQDEDVFEPVPGVKLERPSLRVIASGDGTNPRVTIRRTAPAASDVPAPPPEAGAAQTAEPVVSEVATTPEPAKPRIVVVRRASSEQLTIPLANETPENAVA